MHNAVPGFTKNGVVGTPNTPSAANTNGQGAGTVGTNVFQIMQADTTNGTYIDYIRAFPTASTPTTTTATVARYWISALGGTSVVAAADMFPLGEVALPSVSAGNASIANNVIDFPVKMRIPAGYYVHVTHHAAPAANTGWKTYPVAGDY